MANNLAIDIERPQHLVTGDEVRLRATGIETGKWAYDWHVHDTRGEDADGEFTYRSDTGHVVAYRFGPEPGIYRIGVVGKPARGEPDTDHITVAVQARPLTRGDAVTVRGGDLRDPVAVNLRRSAIVDTPDLPLWSVIRASTNKLSFSNYQVWMDRLFCRGAREFKELLAPYLRNCLPCPDTISYQALKLATEAFLLTNCGVAWAVGDLSELSEADAPLASSLSREHFDNLSDEERDERLGLDFGDTASRLWKQYLVPLEGDRDPAERQAPAETLPYLALVRRNLPEWRIDLRKDAAASIQLCDEIIGRKFTSPCFLELLWSYWHEEGMLVQSINAICMRFQNRSAGAHDPLVGLALDPLRPLNNLLWGYIQDEQHRLTLTRRLCEYDSEYGFTLFGRALPRLRTADPRSRFLEAFHTLLHRASIFYKQDDDTTMIADPFPVLNAIRDVHLLLAEGAHNQYGDLPWTARQEMLIQQWLLSRPELREFLPTRTALAYPEEWMHRVDAMKRIQGWSDTSVRYFRDLGVFGEQILLSIRYGDWSNVFDREQAGNWARYWRQEVQWYSHAYQTVTGVDVSADTADVRQAQLPPDRFTQPAFLLRDRLVEQRRRLPRFALERSGERRALPPGHPQQRDLRELEGADRHPLSG